MKPGIEPAFILNFVDCWNELFRSVTLTSKDQNKTTLHRTDRFISRFTFDWGSMSAAAVFTIRPTMILFAFACRCIVQGLTVERVKG